MILPAVDVGSLLAIVTASLDESGILLEANAGFLRLLPAGSETGPIGKHADQLFIQPSFSTLATLPAGSDGRVYHGLMTLGDYAGHTRTLRGSVHHLEGRLTLLAEYDIAELERISERMLALNHDYAKAQFELTQVNLTLQRLKNELEDRVSDRTQALSDALVRADSANRAKQDFLAMMGHELRTPLHRILLLAGILEPRLADPELKEHIDNITDAGSHLADLVNDILMMARLQAEHFELETIDFDVYKVVSDAETAVRGRAAAKGLTLSHAGMLLPQASGPNPVFMQRGDPQRLRQILSHLLDNAIKFSGKGVITLRMRLNETDAGHRILRFEVEDEGIGIGAEKLPRIFNAFEQADNSLNRSFGGAGLGLAICKQIALLMGGNIGVKSTLGKGSLFWLEIPARFHDKSGRGLSRPPSGSAPAAW